MLLYVSPPKFCQSSVFGTQILGLNYGIEFVEIFEFTEQFPLHTDISANSTPKIIKQNCLSKCFEEFML